MFEGINPDPRPSYAAEWYEWWPGEPTKQINYTIREAGPADAIQVCRLLNCSKKCFLRWISQNCYSLWIISRNRRYAVASFVTLHGPDYTRLLRIRVTGKYLNEKVFGKITALCAAGLPEYPTEVTLPLAETEHVRLLRGAGWKVRGSDDEEGTVTLEYPALI